MCAVELRRGGLHLTGTSLSLDARRKSALSFVSHAHADHIARHQRTIATRETLRLMTHRLGELPAPLSVPYRRSFELGPLVLELLPAGHVLGSAQLRVIREDGTRITYTGDLNLVPSRTAAPAEVGECDVLVMEATFGHPRYAFPPKEETLGAIEQWARAQLERDVTPVLLAYALGKSQEAISFLSSRGLALCAHPSIHEVCALYGELGHPLQVRCFEGEVRAGEVLVFPPHLARSAVLGRVRPRRVAALTGWAVEGPQVARRYGADLAFPLSDHADHRALVAYARATGAKEVVTCHGFARELAQALRQGGLPARAIDEPLQLELL
jgi:putative mRNA 3-end processing factor